MHYMMSAELKKHTKITVYMYKWFIEHICIVKEELFEIFPLQIAYPCALVVIKLYNSFIDQTVFIRVEIT